MNSLIDCSLLRCQSLDRDEWLQYRKALKVSVSSSGINVLDTNSSSMVLDFPIHSIEKVEFMRNGINRIFCGPENRDLAIKISTEEGCRQFRRAVEFCGISFSNSLLSPNSTIMDEQFCLPDLSKPEVHEFIMDLLYADGFQDFVAELKKMIDGNYNKH